MGHCSSPPSNFEQSEAAIDLAVKENRLLTMEIEFSLRCNFSCPYCYVSQMDSFPDELTTAEIEDAILQAKALGAQKIIILGGEPSIYPHIRDRINFIRHQGLQVELFTNGTGVTQSFAQYLHENQVRVVLKMNSFLPELQDRLTGKKGSYDIIQSALKALKEVGYPSIDETAFLAVSTIICKQNFEELPEMWQWLRNQGISPYFEIITPQASALDNQWLFVSPARLYRLFAQLADIDRNVYNIHWDPQPPLVGNRCRRHLFSCVVTAKGDVMPCVGLNLSLGNIRDRKLKEILSESPVLKELKNYRHTIKGPCRDCEKAAHCYGCRGAAYQMTGDYLASDPLCWRLFKKN